MKSKYMIVGFNKDGEELFCEYGIKTIDEAKDCARIAVAKHHGSSTGDRVSRVVAGRFAEEGEILDKIGGDGWEWKWDIHDL